VQRNSTTFYSRSTQFYPLTKWNTEAEKL